MLEIYIFFLFFLFTLGANGCVYLMCQPLLHYYQWSPHGMVLVLFICFLFPLSSFLCFFVPPHAFVAQTVAGVFLQKMDCCSYAYFNAHKRTMLYILLWFLLYSPSNIFSRCIQVTVYIINLLLVLMHVLQGEQQHSLASTPLVVDAWLVQFPANKNSTLLSFLTHVFFRIHWAFLWTVHTGTELLGLTE